MDSVFGAEKDRTAALRPLTPEDVSDYIRELADADGIVELKTEHVAFLLHLAGVWTYSPRHGYVRVFADTFADSVLRWQSVLHWQRVRADVAAEGDGSNETSSPPTYPTDRRRPRGGSLP